jgi:putative polyketide hydroxylase
VDGTPVDAVVEVPVLIVGGGPTGLTASVLLSRSGVASLTVERHPGTSIYPRAIAINTRSMEIFRGLGLEGQIRAAGFDAEPRLAVSTTLVDPNVVVSPSLGTPDTGVSPSEFTLCSQFALEPILRRDVESSPHARVWFNTELVAFEQDADGVRALVVDREHGHRTEVRANHMLAADGANSFVRRQLGLELVGTGGFGHNIAIHFEAPLMAHLPRRPIFLHFVQNDRARGLMFTTDGASRWVFNTGYDPDAGETPGDFTTSRCVQLIRDGSGVAGLDVKVRALIPWEMHGDMATGFRVGNVFLAGDAAHRMTPAGGLGMNTGIQDAHNLAWKLAAVQHGWADESLLETYEVERRPVAQGNVDRSVTLARNGATPTAGAPAHLPGAPSPPPGARTAIDFDMGFAYASAAVVRDEAPVDPGDGDYHPDARPGFRVPHCWLVDRDHRVSTHDLLGTHFTLFHGGATDQWERAASTVTARTRVPLATQTLATASGVDAHRLFGISASGAVLVRPDGHVAWRQPRAAASPARDLYDALRIAVCTAASAYGAALAAPAA